MLARRIWFWCNACMTDAFCNVTIEAARPYVYVTIEEVPQGKWGLAGHPLPDPAKAEGTGHATGFWRRHAHLDPA
jgi:hypothetical protein